MKKILPLVLFIVAVNSNAQSEKKEPPPPPPKPKVVEERVKFSPPRVVKDVNVQSKESAAKEVIEERKVTPPEIIVDEVVNASKPKEPPVIKVRGKVADDFYRRNPTVADISSRGNVISIKNKDGTIEKYNMNKREEDKSFTEKYGESPIPPPPPAPKRSHKE